MSTPSLTTTQRPLILLPPSPDTDVLGAAYGLAHFLHARGAAPTLVCTDDVRTRAPFLTPPETVTTTLGGLQDFIIQFDTTHGAINDVRVTRTDTAVTIAVTPEKNFIDPRDFSFAPSQLHYDALFVCGADSVEATGLLTDDNAPILAELPTTTYTTSPTQSILSMVLYDTLWHADNEAITKDVAQSLLTGIVAATDGLRSDAISADVFRAGSTLMQRGADLQTIMLALYKTVSFDFLRLWGGILDRLTLRAAGRIATAHVAPLYGDDPMLLSLMLMRTAQFLPHIHVLGVFWTTAHTPATRGMVLPITPQATTALPSLFATVTAAPHGCLSVAADDAPDVLAAHIAHTLEEARD